MYTLSLHDALPILRVVDERGIETIDLGPEQRIVEVKLSDGPEGLALGNDVSRGELPRRGRRGRRLRRVRRRLRCVRPSLRGVLRHEQGRRPREQPCHKGEQGCSFRTADRRPPHQGPPGTRRAIPPCPPPRAPPWQWLWPARNRPSPPRLPRLPRPHPATTTGALRAR